MKALPLAAATALTIGTFALTTVTAPTPAKADPGYDCIASGGIWVMLESSGNCGHGSTGMELTSSAGFNPIRKGRSGMVCQIAGYPDDAIAAKVCKDGWTAKEEYLQIWWYIGNEWIYADLGADEPNPAGLKAYAWIFGETGKVKPTYIPQTPPPDPTTQAPPPPPPPTTQESRPTWAPPPPPETADEEHKSCAALGRTNVPVGDPDYRVWLDTDGDGVACKDKPSTAPSSSASVSPSGSASGSPTPGHSATASASSKKTATPKSSSVTPIRPNTSGTATKGSPVGLIVTGVLLAVAAAGAAGYFFWRKRQH